MRIASFRRCGMRSFPNCRAHNVNGFPDPHCNRFCNRNESNRVRFAHLGSLGYPCLLGFDWVLHAAQT